MSFEIHLKNQAGKFLLFYIQHTFYLGKDIVTKHTQEKKGKMHHKLAPYKI
jgi:hypothetical protein